MLAALALLAGCAGQPAAPMLLRADALQPGQGRVAVAMSRLPAVDTAMPGARGLVFKLAVVAMNSSLTARAHTLSGGELVRAKHEVAQRLRDKGLDVVVVDEPVDIDSLERLRGDFPGAVQRDFAPLGRKYMADRIVVLQVDQLGFERSYTVAVPDGDPMAVVRGAGYLVNLRTQTYEWYTRISILRGAAPGAAWDEPPTYPALTAAFQQALALGRDEFLRPFERR